MTDLEKYIEDVGLFYDRLGLPKMAGRILGFLAATDQDQHSFDEIIKQLKASKGSISGNINFLVKQRLIEKLMITGDRKSYYRFATDNIFKIINQKVTSIKEVKQIFIGANNINKNLGSPRRKKIIDIIEFYDFLELEIPKLRDKFLKQKAGENEF